MGVKALLKHAAGRIAPSRVLVRGSQASGAVALTFDDGPHAANTPLILDVLAQFKVPATFFVQGSNASVARNLVWTIADQGHTLGNHGYHHLHWKAESTTALLHDVERTQVLIDDIVGRPQPKLYRPPYGEISPRGAWALWRRGYCIVLWSADTHDSFVASPADLLDRLGRSTSVRAGDVILLHDDGAHTVAALPLLIEGILRQGLTIRPVAELRSRPPS